MSSFCKGSSIERKQNFKKRSDEERSESAAVEDCRSGVSDQRDCVGRNLDKKRPQDALVATRNIVERQKILREVKPMAGPDGHSYAKGGGCLETSLRNQRCREAGQEGAREQMKTAMRG